MSGCMDKWMGGRMSGCMDKWMGGRMSGCMDKWMGGWVAYPLSFLAAILKMMAGLLVVSM